MIGCCCPCCQGVRLVSGDTPESACLSCGHRWRDDALPIAYYQRSSGRNSGVSRDLERKIHDRLAYLRPFLSDGIRVLEIGCAEGLLGERLKKIARVTYFGLEVSNDAEAAEKRLDQVIRAAAADCRQPPFDLILSFHVLEHIADAAGELAHWLRLMNPSAVLVVETPNGSGHPLLQNDANPEHVHQFTVASLSTLLQRSGMRVSQVTTGHFESPVYPDSIRMIASPRPSALSRHEQLIARFVSCLGKEFVVYAVGGDFQNYVLPLLDQLPVAALCDGNPASAGRRIGRHEISPYQPEKWRGLPVLIASTRHKPEITDWLQSRGVPAKDIHGLDEVY